MTQKAISLVTAAAILIVYLWSQLQPNDALFLLLSSNLIINIGLVGLAAVLVRLSFATRFQTAQGYLMTATGSFACLLAGGIGLASATYNFSFLSWLGPLDFLLLIEAGVMLAIYSLSYEHQPVKLPIKAPFASLRLPKPYFNLALPRMTWQSLRHLRIG